MQDNAAQFKHRFTSVDYLLILTSNLNGQNQSGQSSQSAVNILFTQFVAVGRLGRVKARKIIENLTQYGTRAN